MFTGLDIALYVVTLLWQTSIKNEAPSDATEYWHTYIARMYNFFDACEYFEKRHYGFMPSYVRYINR